MSENRVSIPVDQIHVPKKYVRPLDEAAALVLARQMEAEGQKTPIAVYKSTARDGGMLPFTMIYGARRLWAAKYLEWPEIEAVLRLQADAPMLAVADNLASPTLDALEQAEHFTAYRQWWECTYGPFGRGGDRKSNGHRDRLNGDESDTEKRNFYKDLSYKFNINERTARRLHSIGRIHHDLRTALRGTVYAKDQKYLIKLTKFGPFEQAGIAGAMKIEPDLDAVLRMDDPATGRKGVGRHDKPDWLEEHLCDHLKRMPADLRDAALERYGYIRKPLDPMPSHLEPVLAVPTPGNVSPLRAMLRDPYRHLSRRFSFEQVLRWKERYEEEERETARYLRSIEQNIQAQEEADRAAFNAERDKAKEKAVRAQRKRTGLSVTLPRREAKMLGELDHALQRKLGDVGGDRSADLVRACHKLNEVRQTEMIRMLYKGCDYAIAIECAQALHYDQLSKARGSARYEIEQPKILIREGRHKRLLPQLVSRLLAVTLDRLVFGRSVFGTLSAEQQLDICRMLDKGKTWEDAQLEARRISPNAMIRQKLRMDMLMQELQHGS